MAQQAKASSRQRCLSSFACVSAVVSPKAPAASRCKASSSVTRVTGVPFGKAISRRLGKAGDRTTKCPRSSLLRIRRPKACASRARMIASS